MGVSTEIFDDFLLQVIWNAWRFVVYIIVMISSEVSHKFLLEIAIAYQIFRVRLSTEVSNKLFFQVVGNAWRFVIVVVMRSSEVSDQIFFQIVVLN